MLLDSGAVRKAIVTLKEALDSHVAYNVKLGNDLRDANNAGYAQAFWLLVSCMAVTLLVSGGMGVQLYRSMTSGLNSIQQTLLQVASRLT